MKNKNSKVILIAIFILVISLISSGLIGYNIFRILSEDTVNFGWVEKEKLTNDYYTIGNNATELQKGIFEELTLKINEGTDKLAIAGLVSESFVADLFTWTNKDGNYEVGGQQYVYGPALLGFKSYVRDTLYSNLDLYIAQYGRDYLPEVMDIQSEAFYGTLFETYLGSYMSYYVYVSWDYKEHVKDETSSSKVVDTSSLPHELHVYVIENDEGRFEVVQFFDSFE